MTRHTDRTAVALLLLMMSIPAQSSSKTMSLWTFTCVAVCVVGTATHQPPSGPHLCFCPSYPFFVDLCVLTIGPPTSVTVCT